MEQPFPPNLKIVGAVMLYDDLKLNDLVEDSLVDEYKRQYPATSSRSEGKEEELTEVGAQGRLQYWKMMGTSTGSNKDVDIPFKLFKSPCASAYEVMTRYRKLAWVVLKDGGVVPLQLAKELGILKDGDEIQYAPDVGERDGGLFVDLCGSTNVSDQS